MTASSSGWTPLFLNAEPHRTGRHRDVERRLADVGLEAVGDRSPSPRGSPPSARRRTRRRPRSARCAASSAASACPPGCRSTRPLLAEVVLVDDRVHRNEVDHAGELSLGADRELDRHRMGAEPVDHRLHALSEVGADAVHLVDVGDPRDAVLVGLAPDRLGLRLDAGDRVEQRDRAVEDAQRALHLDGEVDMAGRVDDVDPVVLPVGRGGRGGDRDAALLLLLHPVHDGRALVDLAHLVGAAGVVEDALGRRRLTGVDVRHDPDVAGLLEGDFAGHLGWFAGGSGGGAGLRAEKRPFRAGDAGKRMPGSCSMSCGSPLDAVDRPGP